MTTLNMRGVMLLAGLFFIGLGIAANMMLFSSFSDDPFYKATYVGMGLGFDLTKSFLLIITILLWVSGLYVLSLFSAFFWTVLTIISISAGFGFMSVVQSQSESAAVLASARYQSAQSAVDNASLNIASLSQYADKAQADTAQAKMDELDGQLTALLSAPARNSVGQKTGKTVKTQLGQGCPGRSWYHGKYCPQIEGLNSDKTKLKAVIDGHLRYVAALTHKETMLNELTGLDVATVGTTSHLHPMFVGLSKLSDYHADTIKFLFLLVSSLTCELLGSFCLLVYSRLGLLITGNPRVFEGTATQGDRGGNVPHTQGINNHYSTIGETSLPNRVDTASTTATQGVSHDTLYQKLKTGVEGQKITNLSFKTLTKTLGIHDNRLITQLRDRLVTDGLAMYDDTRKCLPIAR